MLHLYVFATDQQMLGVEAYHREQAQELAGEGARLVYVSSLRINGTDPRIVFKYTDGYCQHVQEITSP